MFSGRCFRIQCGTGKIDMDAETKEIIEKAARNIAKQYKQECDGVPTAKLIISMGKSHSKYRDNLDKDESVLDIKKV